MKRVLIFLSALSMLGGVSWGQVYISGALSGVLEDTTYIVEGDIWVEEGDSLVIEAGAELLFDGDYEFDIWGYLYAMGTETDSIYFMPNVGVSNWRSIIFDSTASDESELSYCFITGASISGVNIYAIDVTISHCTFWQNSANYGGGIYCSDAEPIIDDCNIIENTATNGGGISCSNSNPLIRECIISYNTALGITADGGGIFISSGTNATIINCFIENNVAEYNGGGLYGYESNIEIHDCVINGNSAQERKGGGLCFHYSDLNLINCDITNNVGGNSIYSADGGGVYVSYSNIANFNNCQVSLNTTVGKGGGINAYGCDTLKIMNSHIDENSSSEGGGVYIGACKFLIYNCDLVGNTASGISLLAGGGIRVSGIRDSSTIVNCDISDNSGGGISLYLSSYDTSFVKIDSCIVYDNYQSAISRGGIYIQGTLELAQAEISNCTIYGNSSINNGGIYVYNCNPRIYKCLIYENSGGGIRCGDNSSPIIENCTIVGNSASGEGAGLYIDHDANPNIVNTIISWNYGVSAIHFEDSFADADISYSDLYNPSNLLSGYIPEGLGVVVMLNANGDSCDIYNNIFLDPLFYSTTGDSAFFLTENSPCIDAGDPDSPLDPDSTIADMGAYYYDQSVWVNPGSSSPQPTAYSLSPAYPNPFNAQTMISFELRAASFVTLVVYDVMGREVAMLMDGFQSSGAYEVSFDGSMLSSGVYFTILQADGFSQVRKMIIIK